MKQDVFGQATSLTKNSQVTDWNAAMLGFLSHCAATPTHLGAVLQDAPDFALGHAAKGMFYLLLGRRELYQVAQEALGAAQSAMQDGDATARERQYVEALESWLAGHPGRSVQVLEDILRDHPRDALAMKLVQAILFVLGDPAGMRASVERILPATAPDHPAHGYLLGCHAFALEETGDYEQAEIAGRKGVLCAPNDAWGLHAVAHVYDMTCEAQRGLEWLNGRETAWAHCNNFRYHVWWHKALIHLDQGQIDVVFDLYDREIRRDKTDDYRDISNATALLARLELEGVNVGDRWEELADLSAARTDDGCLIFADLHYLLALNADNRDTAVAGILQRIHRDAQAGASDANLRMLRPGVDAAQGLVAFSQSRFDEAFQHLAGARASMQLAGGSHAQRDVFERITIDAGIRAGQLDHAETILNQRQNQRAGGEDAFSAARRDLIAAGRGQILPQSVPAQ